jgi:hypothetical protein
LSQPATIELRSASGKHLLDPAFDLAFAIQNAGHFIFKHNKRGHIRSARLKARSSLAPLTRMGEAYKQRLETGHVVYSLRGTPGAIGAVVL